MTQPGRPRAFDRTAALEKAMRLFWQQGYEGTSLSELTTAMGINRPSLYASFGNKEALFIEALDHYESSEGAVLSRLLEDAPDARSGVEASMLHNARTYAGEGRPRGCMIVLSSLVGAPESTKVRRYLAERRQAGEEELRLRIERGKAEGDVPASANARQLAALITTVLQGMSVRALDGAGSTELEEVVHASLAAWPQPG